jgi:hypothetical protein
MTHTHCPFLGTPDDRETALSFPSPNNVCFRSPKPRRTATAHQSSFCLGSGYIHCPVFQGSAAVDDRSAAATARPRRWKLALGLTTLAILALLSMGFLLITQPGFLSVSKTATPDQSDLQELAQLIHATQTESHTATPAWTATKTVTRTTVAATRTTTLTPTLATKTVTSTVRPSSTWTVQPTLTPGTPCGAPMGWVHYTVKMGDTLSMLSVLTRSSITQIQIANCMGNSTNLLAGTNIYLPYIPATQVVPSKTSIPTVTPTFTVQPENTAIATNIPTDIPTEVTLPTETTAAPDTPATP